MKLIAGLGNPGPRYTNTRHNIGFLVINELARQYKIKVQGSLGPAIYGKGSVEGRAVLLLQPTTFMNRSGAALAHAMRHHGFDLRDILIVYDDLDLPLGTIRLRAAGGSGGHKGMESIINSLASREFNRLRVGIGRPPGQDVVDYVLQPFKSSEAELLARVVDAAVEAAAAWIGQGLERAASVFNRDIL